MAEERLQKIIARSGLCSRRDADRMIAEGRVTVDGRTAQTGEKADPVSAHIKLVPHQRSGCTTWRQLVHNHSRSTRRHDHRLGWPLAFDRSRPETADAPP